MIDTRKILDKGIAIKEIIDKATNKEDCFEQIKYQAPDWTDSGIIDFILKCANDRGFDLSKEIEAIQNDLKENNDEDSKYGTKIKVDEEGIKKAIEAYKNRKWAIEGLLYEGNIALIAGRGGCGKSFLSLRILHDLSCGVNIFNEGVQEAKKVLFLTAEDGHASIGGRLDIIDSNKPKDRKIKEHGTIYSLTTAQNATLLEYDKTNRESIKTDYYRWLKTIITNEKFDVLIIDPIANIAGLQDENSNTEPRALINALNELITVRNGKLAIIAVHHLNKTNEDAYNQIRGASALVAGVRLAVVMEYVSTEKSKNNTAYSIFKIAKSNELDIDYCNKIESKAFFISKNGAEIKDKPTNSGENRNNTIRLKPEAEYRDAV